jgi:hypothetical protein
MQLHTYIIPYMTPGLAGRIATAITNALIWSGWPGGRRISLLVDALDVRSAGGGLDGYSR